MSHIVRKPIYLPTGVPNEASNQSEHLCRLIRFFIIPMGNLCIQALQKHAYSNILKISPPKTKSFQMKILIFFQVSAQNIDCGYSLEPPRRGGSNEYPHSMF